MAALDGSSRQSGFDRIQDHPLLAVDFPIGETEDPVASTREVGVARGILGPTRGLPVLLAIDFDDEASRKTGEIDDHPVDRHLASHAMACGRDLLTQPVPQFDFLRRHRLAKRTRPGRRLAGPFAVPASTRFDRLGAEQPCSRRPAPVRASRDSALPYRGGIVVARNHECWRAMVRPFRRTPAGPSAPARGSGRGRRACPRRC